MIIDFHTHIFPDALAPRAIPSLEATAGMPAVFDGTARGLTELMEKDGIDKAVVLNTVTNIKQAEKVNAFAMQTNENFKKLIAFCSLHPLCDDPEKAVKALKEAGFKGIKIHPDYVGIEFDDERMHPLLHAVEEAEMPIIIHAGFDPVSPEKVHASCDAILNALDKFPKLILIAAHLGGINCWDEVAEKLCGKDLYFDTAFCCERIGITIEQGKKIFSKHPHEKILFGSDAPWATPKEILDYIFKLELSRDSLELIFHKNAEKLLNI